MGMPVRIRLYAPTATIATSATAGAFARIATLDRMLSDYRDDSEIQRLARQASAWQFVSPELFAVLSRALEVARASDGAFDPTVGPVVALWRDARRAGRLPSASALEAARQHVGWNLVQLDATRRAVRLAGAGVRLDLGGVAKGFILQDALAALERAGISRALIEAGGDIVVGDPPPGRAGWRIDVEGADAAFAERASRLVRAALATSGPAAQFVEIDGVRYSHVVDPRSGYALTRNITAHVIAPDAATADALATALTVVDPKEVATVLAHFPTAYASLR
jgi:thiamine biosynthesis lipoprotein